MRGHKKNLFVVFLKQDLCKNNCNTYLNYTIWMLWSTGREDWKQSGNSDVNKVSRHHALPQNFDARFKNKTSVAILVASTISWLLIMSVGLGRVVVKHFFSRNILMFDSNIFQNYEFLVGQSVHIYATLYI